MRVRRRIARLTAFIAATVMMLAAWAAHASAQVVEITPLPTESPTSELAPGTQWVYWMAIGAGVIAALILVAVATGYLRFAPRFFGREQTVRTQPPGARPPGLARQAARMRYTPPVPSEHAAAPAPSGARTATAVAERSAAPRPAASAPTAPAPIAPAPAAPPAAAPSPAAAATEQITAPPSGEPAAQADAVGQAEAEAPEARPSAKTAEEVATPQPAAATHAGGSEMDQETFDRVLKEQLDRGVDRRVAEGRARAAAVVSARKKAQG